MRILVPLVGAIAALTGSAVARALLEAEVAAVAAAQLPPSEASADPFYCGYVYSERGLRGEDFALVVGKKVIHNALRSYIMSGECECRFSDATGSQTVDGPGQGDLFRALVMVNCVHTGSVRRGEAKGLEAKDLAISVETSPDEAAPGTIYCGYAYRATNLRGGFIALVAGANTKGYVNSYIISGECLCTFRIGEPGAESTPVLLKGPQQGNLKSEAFTTYCEQDGSRKREEVTAVAAPPGDQTQYCGYAYTAYGFRGDVRHMRINQVSGAPTHFRSYIISGECQCDFQGGGPANPGPKEVIRGPRQGDLSKDAFQVYCFPNGGTKRTEVDIKGPPPTKRNEPQAFAVAAPTPVPSPANEQSTPCGWAYTETNFRGKEFPLEADRLLSSAPARFRSYFVSAACHCDFKFPLWTTVQGPAQGNLDNADVLQVQCSANPHAKRDAPEALGRAVPARGVPAAGFCGYAYAEHGLRGRQVSLPADNRKVHNRIFDSYIISGGCVCRFASKPGAVPGYVVDVKGPQEGELDIAAENVVCKGPGF
jgi:hypothetical protein